MHVMHVFFHNFWFILGAEMNEWSWSPQMCIRGNCLTNRRKRGPISSRWTSWDQQKGDCKGGGASLHVEISAGFSRCRKRRVTSYRAHLNQPACTCPGQVFSSRNVLQWTFLFVSGFINVHILRGLKQSESDESVFHFGEKKKKDLC